MRKLRIALNGLGRIGRLIFQTLLPDQRFEIVAINDPAPPAAFLRSLQQFPSKSRFSYAQQTLKGHCYQIRYTQFLTPPPNFWGAVRADLLIEASGQFTSLNRLKLHLNAGAKRVFLTTNFLDPVLFPQTLIYNFNHETFNWTTQLWSFGSCTTNALFVTLKALSSLLKLTRINVLTIHSVTNHQPLLNRLSSDFLTGAGILDNVIPVPSHAADLLKIFFPACATNVTGLRIPTSTGALLLLSLNFKSPIDLFTLRTHLQTQTNASFQIQFTPLTLAQIRGMKTPAVLDWSLTVLQTYYLQLGVWYDNEVGYVQQIYQMLNYLVTLQNRL